MISGFLIPYWYRIERKHTRRSKLNPLKQVGAVNPGSGILPINGDQADRDDSSLVL